MPVEHCAGRRATTEYLEEEVQHVLLGSPRGQAPRIRIMDTHRRRRGCLALAALDLDPVAYRLRNVARLLQDARQRRQKSAAAVERKLLNFFCLEARTSKDLFDQAPATARCLWSGGSAFGQVAGGGEPSGDDELRLLHPLRVLD